jgi:tRNA dimethylallyltransferase
MVLTVKTRSLEDCATRTILSMIVIVGPTAAGKSARAMALAPQIGAEIISADSRHVYRRMDIGTNKPSPAERAAVPHHLLDLRDPHEGFSLAEYVRLARAAIADVTARGKPALLVGGTGQYIKALTEGWQVPEVPPNAAVRAHWLAFERQKGHDALFAELLARDPDAGHTIDKRNVRRVVRALEVMAATDRRWSDLQRREAPSQPIEWIYVNQPRDQLYAVADARVDFMLAQGWLDEVRELLTFFATQGIDTAAALRLPAMSALGYRELALVALGQSNLAAAIEAIKRETRRFIRMQDTWFRKLTADARGIVD